MPTVQRILNYFEGFGNRIVRFIKNKDIFLVLVIILVAFGSFGFGRLSAIKNTKESVRIENFSPKTASRPIEMTENTQGFPGKFVASRNGTKYYLPWCAGVSRISEQNKVWFDTAAAAVAAGLEPAANCPGL